MTSVNGLDVEAPPGVDAWWEGLNPGLDTYEVIDPHPFQRGRLGDCRQGARAWFLVSEGAGELVRARCKSPNKCSHCREVSARETAEMLATDAEDDPPAVFVVLTARNFLTRPELRRHLDHIRRAVRKVWSSFQYFCALEWQKRGAIHVNLVVKGVGKADAERLSEVIWRVWGSRVDAVREAQSVRPIYGAAGVAKYVAKLARYLGKDDQGAPAGWRGHRTSQTRGYFREGAGAVRALARASLRWKLYRSALRRCGLSAVEAAWQAFAPAAFAALGVWRLLCRDPLTPPVASGLLGRAQRDPPPRDQSHREGATAGALLPATREGPGRLFPPPAAGPATALWV